MSRESPGQQRPARAGRAGAVDALGSVLANRNRGTEAQGPSASSQRRRPAWGPGDRPQSGLWDPGWALLVATAHRSSCRKAAPEQALVRPRRWAVGVRSLSAFLAQAKGRLFPEADTQRGD